MPIPDSSRISREIRKVPTGDIVLFGPIYRKASISSLFFNFIVELPEAHGVLGGFCRQLPVVLQCKFQRSFVDAVFDGPVAKVRFDRRPVQAG